jgi:hypothetical protein
MKSIYVFEMDDDDNIIRLVDTVDKSNIVLYIRSYELPPDELNSPKIIEHYLSMGGMYQYDNDKYCVIDITFDTNILINADEYIYKQHVSMINKAKMYLRNDKLTKIGIDD